MTIRIGSWPVLLALWLLVMLISLVTRPLLPVDETRYATVAWEMWLRGDFLVPYLNGEPYSHKPPLFFWLIHAGWWLFGVHEWVVRAIAPLVGLLTLLATANLARKCWPDDVVTARLAPWIVFGSIFFTAFFSWVQIDLLLVLFTVLAISGIVSAARDNRVGWLLTGVAIGLGVLAKGPVILLQVLPVALLTPLWKRDTTPHFWWSWYAGVVASVMVGAVIALSWALPAAEAGGDAYREAILWGQTANRMVQSFAHAHPVWWYLPWLAVLFAPWVLLPRLWSALRYSRPWRDEGLRLCLVWLAGAFVLMSLVSGKQVKYLLPLLPVFALLVARVISGMDRGDSSYRPWLPAVVLLVSGGLFIVLPRTLDQAPWINNVQPLWGGLLIAAAIVLVMLRPVSMARYPVRLTLFSVFVVSVIYAGIFRTAAPAYDVQAISRMIAAAQAAGHSVASVAHYHGQFGFVGRLQQALVQLDSDSALAWAALHPDDWLVVMTRKTAEQYPKAVFTQPYRSGYLAVWDGRTVIENPAVLP
ncbi:MAG: glycosyltransferase family 39 protein [Gammaproteobacteria bacterium]|nr:glycosyltransferase family 39 protein [Gammaproteobacteria bacterium]